MTAIPKPQRVKDEDYKAYVKSHNCLLLGKYGHVCSGPVEPHHVTPKMQGKVGSKPSDDRCLPFCEALHRQYHYLGSIEAFEQRYPVILEYEILRLQRAYKPPVKAKRELKPGVIWHVVRCACKRTHKLTPGKFNGRSFLCPITRARVEIA